MGPYWLLPLWVKVNLIAMPMKGYSTLHKAPGLEPQYCVEMCHKTKKKSCLSPTAIVMRTVYTSWNVCLLLSFLLFTSSLVTCLCKTLRICIDKPATNHNFHTYPPPFALGVLSWPTDSLHVPPILRSQSSSAREKVASAWWLHPHIHNFHTWHIGMTTQVQTRFLQGGRFPNSSHVPLLWSHTPCNSEQAWLSGMMGFILRWKLSSIELQSAFKQLATMASASRVLMSEAMLSESDFRYTNHALSLSDDSFDSTTGHRSLTWWGMPSTRTDCGLIISVTCPLLSLLCGVLTHTMSPILHFPCALQGAIDICASQPLVIGGHHVSRCCCRWNTILRCCIIPVDHFWDRTSFPGCNHFYRPVASLYCVISRLHVGVPEPKPYTPLSQELWELLCVTILVCGVGTWRVKLSGQI